MTHEMVVLPWSIVPPEKPEDFTNKKYVDERTMPATQSSAGVVKIATNEEVQAGTDENKVVSPAGLSSRPATAARTGLVQLASQDKVNAGTDENCAVTPKTLSGRTATGGRAGLIQIATQDEVNAGKNTDKAVTPATLTKAVVQLASSAPMNIPLIAAGSTTVACPVDANSIMVTGYVRTAVAYIPQAVQITLTFGDETFKMIKNGAIGGDKGHAYFMSYHFPVTHKFSQTVAAGQQVAVALASSGAAIDTVELYAQFFTE